eukprot:TRINITY_DN8698_c0_g1_i1.p1 TRINITY_DN8698_c0_g1~~TRINITY_DN8698_c0_g1_i1.p1  ORF type:complete len:241 (+),score=59.87 TRINITY_DN8698_c0_g1_i1:599-1321(+)
MLKSTLLLSSAVCTILAQEDAASIVNDAAAAAKNVDLAAATEAGEMLQTFEPIPTIAIPEQFQAVFETDILMDGKMQNFVVNVTSAFAPMGAEQFYKLMKDEFYNGACFFRVVPDFVIQFGIGADPEMTKKWSVPILDDPVEVSNEEGTIAFATAGPDTRTTQLFVNYADNKALDAQGFAPIGQVVHGLDALRLAYNPTPGKPGGADQQQYEMKGNAWLKPKVPKINQIVRAYISWESAV